MKSIPSNRETIIWLSSMDFTSNSIKTIMENLNELNDIWNLSDLEIINKLPINSNLQNKILGNRKIEDLKLYIENVGNLGVKIITILDENYPKKLQNIPNRPKILYTKGKDLGIDFSIGIVGSRKCTDYGKWSCSKFSRELAEVGVTIISGMATGIDSISHRQALESNAYTVAVLGCGVDIVYPKKHLGLYNDIIENGTLVSEYPLGTPPKPHNFPMRNRIISGLSDGVVIVEAKEKSGSLITANYALEQGKDVFAIPGNINSIFSSGTNKLIKDGAIPLLNIRDIIEEYDEIKNRFTCKLLESNEGKFTNTEIKLLDMLDEPTHSDDIVYKMEIDIATINTILVELELKGVIKEVGNNIFIRN